jgi:hypothetical protein
MKSLKITLMLAVFCLTISGTSNTSEVTIAKDTIQEVDKTDYKMLADVTNKKKKPPVS